ncbi:MAG TPA: hypothetical protein DEA82_12300, partial [Flavobacteriaceae bacterium]|nr:hypothetical protein [Flavobacteriaceae bacterium]
MIKQNPFSLYDFLGYFIPGATLIYLFIYFSSLDASNYELELTQFFNSDGIQLEGFLFFIILSYAIGHLNNYLSSVLVERYANWIYDYPSKYLLKIEKKFNFKTITIKRILIFISIFPVSILDLVLGQVFKFKNLYVNNLDDFLIYSIKTKSVKVLDKLVPRDSSEKVPNEIGKFDFFRILQHYAFEKTSNHQAKLINYVVLYGFLRSLTLICVFIFWFLIYEEIFQPENGIPFYCSIIVGIASYIFFMAFMKFYRRYTLEALM